MTEDNLNIEENKDKQPEGSDGKPENIPVPESNKPESVQPVEEVKPEPIAEPVPVIAEVAKPETKEEPKAETAPVLGKDSNYQVSLINENLLRIKVTTRKVVNINCSVKDKSTSTELQTNKIELHPKTQDEPQEIEIVISIDPDTGELIVEKKKITR